MSKSMRLVFFTLPGLIVRFNWRFPIGTHRSSASHACNRAADHFIVQPCPHAVGVVIDRAVFTNTEVLRRLDGVNIGAEEQEFPTILALLMLDHLFWFYPQQSFEEMCDALSAMLGEIPISCDSIPA